VAIGLGSFVGWMDYTEDNATSDLTLTLGGRKIFSTSKFILEDDEVEHELSNYMKEVLFNEHKEFPRHQCFMEIGVDFGTEKGTGSAVVLGSDLTAE